MNRFVVVALAVAMVSGTAAAAGMPAPVADYARDLRDRCVRLGGQPAIAPPQRVEITGDRFDDWLVVEGMGDCPGAPGASDPSGGGQVTIYVGQADGSVVPAFQQGIFGLRVEKQKGQSVLWVVTSGLRCGEPGKSDPDLRCDRELQWFEKKRVFDYGPVSSVRIPSRIAP